MKIQFFGGTTFSAVGSKQSVIFNATADTPTTNIDVVTAADGSEVKHEAKKLLNLPGEFEISNILIRGFRSLDGNNVIYKAFFEDTAVVHFGNLTDIPKAKVLENIGENIDVAFVCLSENFKPKQAKELIEKVEPRMCIIGGDSQFFAEFTGMTNTQTAEENPITISKSKLPDESTDLRILPL